MVTYVLDGKSKAHLPKRPLMVSMSVVGVAGAAALDVRHSGVSDPTVIAHSPGMLILPRVEYEMLLVAIPAQGNSTFPSGTTIHVSVAVDSSNEPDPDRAQLTPRDVSGLSYLELATIGPDGDRIAVVTRLEEPEIELGPLASSARAAARSVLRVDQLSDSQQTMLDIRVDTSASMLPAIADGSVRAIMEILAGVSTVISYDRNPEVTMVGNTSAGLRYGGPGDLGSTVHAHLETTKPGIGFGNGDQFDALRPDSMVVLVTDSPSDFVASGRESADSRFASMIASSSRAAQRCRAFAGAVVVPAPDGSDTADYLVSRPSEVEEIVRSFLRPLNDRIANDARGSSI
ncbi:hypothetical protein O1W68_18730 [Rhodococcus sp. H36-A4]|uniref:hypothetical protein n=1 Tax=Rhodococcus sp. H36-A4 TaxID=3004353 RepID=UPI0022AE5A0D|nr:hypothetical protein [Rhodococcus sp. H36-A4]MCZ4079986.1 hypothetical protein [Rhodococcus sp. H36-A4]